MKRRFSKILGVGLTLALLFSLILTAAPVSALSTASVTVSPATISEVDADYTIRFQLDKELYGQGAVNVGTLAFTLPDVGDEFTLTAAAPNDTATLTFPLTSGSVDVVLSGSGTYNATSGLIAFAATNEVATVTATAFDTAGAWTQTGSPTAAPGTDVATDDTITITFLADTTIAAAAPTATISASWGWVGGAWAGAVLSTTNWTSDDTARTITVALAPGDKIGEGATVRIVITAGITNPDDADDYNLTVETSQEDAETSADYEITVPDIGVLPGIVQLSNSTGTPMAQATGDEAIEAMVDLAKEGYTIVVGPGEYAITATIDLDEAGVILKSSGDTEDTIIVGASGYAIEITAAEVTVDGFTVEVGGGGIRIAGADAIVKNNMIDAEDPTEIGIYIFGDGASVSDNEIGENCTIIVHNVSDGTISGNTLGECINLMPSTLIDGLTITDNTMIGSVGRAIDFVYGTFNDILIEDNTISGAAPNAINIRDVSVTNLRILNNDITDNEGVGIQIGSGVTTPTPGAIAIKFNTITGNDADGDGYGIQNDATDATDIVDATLNWWGTAVADDVAAMVSDTGNSVTAYEPFLADTADAVFSASDVAVGVNSIAKDTAGVAVSVTQGTPETVDIIAVAKYIANPEEAISGAIAFYDVYAASDTPYAATDTATIKFYAGDANTEVYIWSADTLTWGKVQDEDVSYSAYGGYVWVVIEDPAMLTGTPFALVAGTAEAIDPPTISSPVVGDDTVRLRPVFAWEAVPEADGYYFQLADNAEFVVPMVKMEGDMGRLSGTTYAYVGEELPYSTPYHWRVKAVSGTTGAGDLAESAWTGGVFITMDEPVEPTPPVVVEPTPPAPPAPIIEPIVEVIVPPATAAMTPGWIYAIIGVGAVLVIALIVLIVRTRRVA